MKLTIPGQPIGCPPCQRPTLLPGRSARKHRCSPGLAVRNDAALVNPGTPEHQLLWLSQRNVRGGGAQTCALLLRYIGRAVQLHEEWFLIESCRMMMISH